MEAIWKRLYRKASAALSVDGSEDIEGDDEGEEQRRPQKETALGIPPEGQRLSP